MGTQEPNILATSVLRVLRNRGIDENKMHDLLNPVKDFLTDPLCLDNIGYGVELLMKHLAEKSTIFIQVDSDVDGYTSAALLYLYIKRLDPDAKIIWRVHEGKQHGVIVDTVPEGVGLVILPDSGSSQYKEHKELFDKGIHVLVLDHHETERESEHALVINNQMGDHPNRSLCGVAVVHKFCKFIDMTLGYNYADDYLDITAIGLIADMMDMRELENRWYVVNGISEIKNPFIREIVAKNAYSIGDELTPMGVSFYVAPLINGVVRVGSKAEKEMMFEAFIAGDEPIQSKKRGAKPGDLVPRAQEMARIAGNVKNKQKRTTDKVVEALEGIIERDNLLDNQILMLKVGRETVPQELTGLVANKLMGQHKKPVLILRETKAGLLQGSGRNHDKNELDDFRGYLNGLEYFEYAEGHASAFGAGLKTSEADRFIADSNEQLAHIKFDSSTYEVDFILSKDEISQEFLTGIGEMEGVWSKGIEQPYLALENIVVPSSDITLMSPDKRPTLKFIINGTPVIKFGSSKQEYERLTKNPDGGVVVNIVARPNRNEYHGRVTYQLMAQEYEVIGTEEFIF